MRKLSKTLLSLLLIAAMLASFVVLPAAAEEPAAEQPTEAVQAAETQAADSSFMKIFHLDCGRKYFTKDWILALINEISAAGYTHLQLAIGNDGMRFLLDDMSLTVGDKTYSSEDVAAAIHAGNVAYDNRQSYTPEKDELTESEMNAIISYATSKGITVIPLINNPGHMDAILSAATSLTGTTCSYNGSVTTINLENEDAVAFTKAFLTKYVEYFAAKGCTHFGIGADEYANDVYTYGSMGFGQLVSDGKYGKFIAYVNSVAGIVKSSNMKPVAFNDGFYFNGNTTSGTFSTDIVISFWTSGWGGYQSETASQLAARGHQMINTNGDFYYVLGKSDKFDSGYDYASKFSNTAFMGSTVSNPAGATFCVWCDYPGAETEQEIAQKIRLPLRAMAQRMKGESVVLDENELVSGGFKADGTINTDVDVAEDAATGIKVSAPSVKTVDVTVKTDNLPEVTGAAEVLAWEITPRDADGNAYTGEGTVTLHIPEAWTGANVYGAVVNADGSLTTIKENVALDETNSTITFTVPHFSTVLAVKENKTEVINLTLGQTKSVSLKGEDLTGKITKATDFDTYASLNAAYTPSKTETKIGSKLSSLPTGTTIVLTDGKGNYAKLNSSNYLENTTAEAEATIWTIEKSGSSYYLKSGNNYLNPSNSFSNVSYDVSTSKNNSWKWSSNGGFSYTPYYYYTYYLGYNNSTWGMSTTSGTGIAYGVTTETIDAATTLTFTGVAIGTTYVTVDNIQYKVVVSAEDLKNVTPLTVEYWITNKQVYDGTTYSSSLPTSKDIAAANVHFEEGVLLESLVPATGVNSDSNPMVFWKSTRLASDNKQTTGSGVDKTRSGSDFTYIRYWNGSWSYSADGVNWVNAETGDQFVAYYLQKTEVTKEVETQVVDWGPQRDNWSSLNYLGTKYVLMDYAVKYESGEQVPSTFPTADTLAFHCDTSTTKNNVYYREIGMIRAKETDEYEVYMITLTPTSDTPTDTLKGSTAAGNNSYEYKGTETVVWADTQEDLDASGLGTYTSISGTFTYSIGGEPIVPGVEIYRRQAMKVTYYVRAKVTEDSLTVHYIDKTANREFYSYNIAVAQGTYFNANIGLNKDAWKGPLVNGEVTNLKGNIQTVSADLSTLPALSAQYLYSDYTCVEVTRSTGNTETGTPAGKEVYLYYTFNNKHTFVVDFGVPLKIGPKDINLSETGWTTAKVNNVSEYKALYGTAKISVNEGLTYTLTKPMQGVETLQVTLGKEGEDPATHTIYLVPATTVYYEQNVATYSNGWELQGTAIAADKYQETQKGRTPGYNFGYDPYYEANQLGANGSVEYTNTKGADATLTFKGTGMELYLRTQNANETSNLNETDATNHSYMLVQVYAGDTADANNLKRMSFVDVNNLFVQHGTDKYGYNTPCWTVDGMTYGTYTVVVRYVKGTTYGLAIDGFRVTNTLNPDNATTKDFYAAVHEDNMQTSEIRNMVLKQAEVYNLADNWYKVGNEVIDAVYDAEDAARIINGAVLIKQNYDQNGGTDVQVTSDLVNIGPKNEIYLNPGEAVVMTVPTTYTTVQVGMRSLTGATVKYQINSEAEKEMKSTVDMYYKVKLVEGKLVIQNVSGGILALTKLKVTGAGTTTNDVSVETTPEAIRYAMALMRGIDVPQFTDVAEDAWYHDYVYDLVYRGVVNGMTATTYEPEGKLTRAQFVKLLACSLADAETLKTYEGKHPFKDSEGHWAEAYIAWAKDKGIVEGVSATEFDPEAPITREQMATIFGRYALKQGIELPKDAAPAQSFPDADKISEYAREFVELMRIAGILNGYEDGTFRPQGNATRAEAAKLFSLFLSITDKLAK